MRKGRAKGMTIVVVLGVISLAAASAVILTSSTALLGFDSDRLVAEAVSRNMLASGLAWTDLHRRDASRLQPQAGKKLDVAEFAGGGVELVISPAVPRGAKSSTVVLASCRKGRWTARDKGKVP